MSLFSFCLMLFLVGIVTLFYLVFIAPALAPSMIAGKSLLEVIIRELIFPHKYFLLVAFILIFNNLKYHFPSIKIKKRLLQTCALTLAFSLLISIVPITRWLILKDISKGTTAVSYIRYPVDYSWSSPGTFLTVKKTDGNVLEVVRTLEARILIREKLLSLVSYGSDTHVRVSAIKKVSGVGELSPIYYTKINKFEEYESAPGEELIKIYIQ